jgi:DNA-3-methyladenine glycosylase II
VSTPTTRAINAATAHGSFRAGAKALAERDPVMARMYAEFGPPTLPVSKEEPFGALVRAIVYQQLAGAAARAIHSRLVVLLGDVTPERMLEVTAEQLRAVGLSGNKVLSVQDLAHKVLDGTAVVDARRLARLGNEEIVARLSTVRGIGKWSAEMFLMFQLRRLDIWPTGDLVVRKGFGLAWQIPTPTPKALELLGEPYHPYRSVVAWYCWQAAGRYGAREVVLPD